MLQDLCFVVVGTGSARREGHHGGAGLVQRRTNMANQERRRCCAASWCSCPYPPLDPTWNVPATVRRQIRAVPHRVPCDCDLIPAVQHLLHSMRREVRGRRSASSSVSFSGRSTPFSPRARRVRIHCRRLEKKNGEGAMGTTTAGKGYIPIGDKRNSFLSKTCSNSQFL